MKCECPYCEGAGKISGRLCKKCGGTGVIKEHEHGNTVIQEEDDGYCD
mgnify:CR=1 FL=1